MPFTKMRNSCAPIFSKETKKEVERSFLYNVIPEYKALTKQEIRDKIQENTLPYAVIFQNWTSDFNIACGMRSASALGAKEVFYLGSKTIDKRALTGIYHYKDFTWLEDEDHLLSLKDRYNFVAVDKLPNSIPVQEFDFSKENNCYLFGSEAEGLLPCIIDMCDSAIHINQRGSVPSLNAASASTVIMTFAEIALGKYQPVK